MRSQTESSDLAKLLDEVPVLWVLLIAFQVNREKGVAPAGILVEEMRRHFAVTITLVHHRHDVEEPANLHLEQPLDEEATLHVVAHLRNETPCVFAAASQQCSAFSAILGRWYVTQQLVNHAGLGHDLGTRRSQRIAPKGDRTDAGLLCIGSVLLLTWDAETAYVGRKYLQRTPVALGEKVVHHLVVDLVKRSTYSHRYRRRQGGDLLEKVPHRPRHQPLGPVADANGGGRLPAVPWSNTAAWAAAWSKDLLTTGHGVGLACTGCPISENRS